MVATGRHNEEASDLAPARPESQWSIVLRRFRRHRLALISLAVLILIFVASVLAPYIAPFPDDVYRDALDRRFLTPMSRDIEGNQHILGTDNLGRDYFTRLLFAARVSLTIAVTVALVATAIGLTLGLLAGYFGGWTDTLITRFLEFVSTFPLLIILLILMAVLIQSGESIPIPDVLVDFVSWATAIKQTEARKVTMVIMVLALLNWPPTARLMRGMVFSVREQVYIESARALGASNPRIILKHVFPNAFPPLIVDFTLQLNTLLVLESALSFLGYGVQDPTPTWGNMLSFAQDYMFQHPWMPLVPGLPILITSLAINYVGDGLRDALDPRLKL